MAQTPTPETVTWSGGYQVGIVVRDIEQTAQFFESVGIGPFREGPSAHAVERYVNGRPEPDARVACKVTQMGAFELELIQPVAGNSLQAAFLSEHGESVMHLCAYTDDLQRDIAAMNARGYDTLAFAKFDDGGTCAFFDTRAAGGVLLELFQPGSKWT